MFSSDLLQQSNLSTQWDPHTPLISHQIWSTFHRSSHSHYTIHHHEPRRKNGFIVTIYVGFEYIAFSYQYALCGFGINILFFFFFLFPLLSYTDFLFGSRFRFIPSVYGAFVPSFQESMPCKDHLDFGMHH